MEPYRVLDLWVALFVALGWVPVLGLAPALTVWPAVGAGAAGMLGVAAWLARRRPALDTGPFWRVGLVAALLWPGLTLLAGVAGLEVGEGYALYPVGFVVAVAVERLWQPLGAGADGG
jgi:hypothetical protein